MASDELNRETRQHYNDLIPALQGEYVAYRWHSGPVQRSHYRHTQEAISRAFQELGPVRKLLEVGPGPGTWTNLCLSNAQDVTLCDISREMLKQARGHFGEAVRYVEGDFTADDTVVETEYDAIVSFRALEYMSDKGGFVRRVYEHLAPGGALMVITKNPGWRDKRSAGNAEDIHRDWISWTDLAQLVRGAGFTDVQAFPVAVGSYHRPFNNRLGVAVCDIWQRLILGRSMRKSWDGLVESYLITARKG